MKDLLILGNGMAGMTAALYAKRANLDFKIVGRGEYEFGQIENAILVENFPCIESQKGIDLAIKLHDQLESTGVEFEEYEIITVDYKDSNRKDFAVTYADGSIDEAKAVIYALGASHRKLNCKIDKEIPVHYCALCDGNFYKDKVVAIIGGGDVAFTQAEYLSKICRLVYIVMCDENVTASPATFERVDKIDNIAIIYNYPISEIVRYENGKYGLYKENSGLSIYSNANVQADGIFVAIGMQPNTSPIKIPYVLNHLGYINANENGVTIIDGFFAIGDVRHKQVRQAITAAADGANVIQSVIQYLKESRE